MTETATVEAPSTVIPDAPLTLSMLRQSLPPYTDEKFDGIGTFRLHRLGSLEILRQQMMVAEITDDDGTAPKDEAMRMMLGFVAKSLGGDFDSPEGVETLMALPPGVQTRLMQRAAEFHMLRVVKKVELIDEAKND